jgi:protein-S-isoprenylcysteine O-methyltransferase Ste14
MFTLETLERASRRAGTVGALLVSGSLIWGVWRTRNRPLGREAGRSAFVRRDSFLVSVTLVFVGACWRLWRPLPLTLPPGGRVLALALGAPLLAVGFGLVLAGRLTLGQNFNVSTSLGAPLYADQRLVTGGPYRLVRHPMYLGYLLASLGGLLVYRTWTTLVLAPMPLTLAFRARREEQALAARFGPEWAAYCRGVPAWLPRLTWPAWRKADRHGT